MEIHKAFQEKFSPDVLVEKTQPLPVYYGNVCLRQAEQPYEKKSHLNQVFDYKISVFCCEFHGP
jgi:hypothetical protein